MKAPARNASPEAVRLRTAAFAFVRRPFDARDDHDRAGCAANRELLSAALAYATAVASDEPPTHARWFRGLIERAIAQARSKRYLRPEDRAAHVLDLLAEAVGMDRGEATRLLMAPEPRRPGPVILAAVRPRKEA